MTSPLKEGTPRCDVYEVKDGIRYVSVPRSGLPDWPSFARQLERELSQSQERCAELEKDAARYRKLKAAITVPMAMQSFLKHMNWHPDTFKMGIDEAIDSALSRKD